MEIGMRAVAPIAIDGSNGAAESGKLAPKIQAQESRLGQHTNRSHHHQHENMSQEPDSARLIKGIGFGAGFLG